MVNHKSKISYLIILYFEPTFDICISSIKSNTNSNVWREYDNNIHFSFYRAGLDHEPVQFYFSMHVVLDYLIFLVNGWKNEINILNLLPEKHIILFYILSWNKSTENNKCYHQSIILTSFSSYLIMHFFIMKYLLKKKFQQVNLR